MNKLFTAALGLAVAVLPVLGVGVAAADTDLSCDDAKAAVVKAQTRVDNRAATERVEENKALKAAQKVVDELKLADPVNQDALRDARVLRDAARDALNTDSKRLAELRVLLEAAVADRDEACSEPTTTPPTPTPTTTPAPTTEPFPVDLDCDDLSDQEAQRILDADRSDPHNLDSDEDGFACDENQDDGDVVTPVGGVNTGGWRR